MAIFYVSTKGDDNNDGLSLETAVATPDKAATLAAATGEESTIYVDEGTYSTARIQSLTRSTTLNYYALIKGKPPKILLTDSNSRVNYAGSARFFNFIFQPSVSGARMSVSKDKNYIYFFNCLFLRNGSMSKPVFTVNDMDGTSNYYKYFYNCTFLCSGQNLSSMGKCNAINCTAEGNYTFDTSRLNVTNCKAKATFDSKYYITNTYANNNTYGIYSGEHAWTTRFMIKQNDSYYSVWSSHYDTTTKAFKPYTEFDVAKAFLISDLTTEITVGEETFKPIDKFSGKIELVSKYDHNKTFGMHMPTSSESELILGDPLDVRQIQSLDLTDHSSNLKTAVCVDDRRWYTYDANTKELVQLNMRVPLDKKYSDFTQNEQTLWENARQLIEEQGFMSKYISEIDFASMEIGKIRFAHILTDNELLGEIVPRTALPYNFVSGCAVKLNGELHILGGTGGKKSHYVYRHEKWIEDVVLPYEFVDGKAVVWNDELHILGGIANPYGHYKLKDGTWISCSTLPYNFIDGMVTVYQDKIHLIGGHLPDVDYGSIPSVETAFDSYADNKATNYTIYCVNGKYIMVSANTFGFSTYSSSYASITCSSGTSSEKITRWVVDENGKWKPYGDTYSATQDVDAILDVTLTDYYGLDATTFSKDFENHLVYTSIDICDNSSASVCYNMGYQLNWSPLSFYSYDGTSWTGGVTLPSDSYSGRAVVLNDAVLGSRLCVIGGNNKSLMYKYDGETWTTIDLPYNFVHGSALVYNSKIYIIGSDCSEEESLHVYKYNGTTWESFVDLPYGHLQGDAVVLDDYIYVLGSSETGYERKNSSILLKDIVEHYYMSPSYESEQYTDKTKNKLTLFSATDVGFANEHDLTSKIAENKALPIFSDNASRIKTQDGIATDWWLNSMNEKGIISKLDTTLPYKFHTGAAVVYKNEIHILGSKVSGLTTQHWKFSNGIWTEVGSLPYNFQGGSAIVWNDKIHLIGADTSGNSSKHYIYDGTTWAKESTLPHNYYNGCAVIYNNEIHLLGAENTNYVKAHYKYTGSQWEKVSELPIRFIYGCAVVFNNCIYILGTSSNVTAFYKWDGSSWETLGTLPFEFYGGSAVVYNAQIYIFGGVKNPKSIYTFDGVKWEQKQDIPYSFSYGCALEYDSKIYLLGSNDSDSNKLMSTLVDAQFYIVSTGELSSDYLSKEKAINFGFNI